MNIVQSGVGAIFQSDLARAQTCNACIVAFNVKCCKISSAYARVKVSDLCSKIL